MQVLRDQASEAIDLAQRIAGDIEKLLETEEGRGFFSVQEYRAMTEAQTLARQFVTHYS
jgi:hypothetical protein